MMPLPYDWDPQAVAARRERFYAATQRKFVPYEQPMIFRRGQGQYLWDENDNRFIDLLAMNVCVSVGHAHPEVNAAAAAQAQELTHCTTMFYHPAPAHLAEELIATLPTGADWTVHFTSSGAEAVDLALTLARGHTRRATMLAVRNGYHGPTIGAQSVTGIAGFRHNMPMPPEVAFVEDPNPFRGVFGENLEAYLDNVEQVIRSASPGQVAGMIVEPVQGYGGIVSMPRGYLAGAAERVRAAGGLLIADEVQSGFGRTGEHMWAFEADGVLPDIVVMAKGIANGYPLGATVVRREIADSLADKFLFHTYGSNPVCCAAGRAVLQVLKQEQLQENARRVGAELLTRLRQLQQSHPRLGDVRGKGLMLALEFVKNPNTREPDPETTAQVFENARQAGLILSKSGPYRSVLRMVPPLCLSLDDVDVICDGLEQSMQQ